MLWAENVVEIPVYWTEGGIYRKARAIMVPEQDGQRMLVEYRFYPRTGKFATMFLIPQGPLFKRQTVFRVIDFYEPRSSAVYDKTGYKNFLFALKAILFRDQSHRMSRQAREEFFSYDANLKFD